MILPICALVTGLAAIAAFVCIALEIYTQLKK